MRIYTANHKPNFDIAEELERRIRARERQTIGWLREKPWLAGCGLARTVATCRRIHTASIARSNADRRSLAND
jgi:hypothetical protein